MIDLKQVEDLIALMKASGVSQLSLELPEFKVSITRGHEGTIVTSEPPVETAAPPAELQHTAVSDLPAEPERMQVVSPVVGVFHNGGMLDPRTLVKVGDTVREGQLLAAIEAMKVPNELRSPISGTVRNLLVADGSAVEYGQTLFLIEPEGYAEANDAEPIGLA